MNIGTAIKTLRKQKRLTQEELGDKCDLSINALSQIETNSTFPQKSTIKAICSALEVPVSYLLFLSINDEDIPDEKRIAFNHLSNALKAVLLDDIQGKQSNK
jgi:transcriptional regulator with XRE-family HTH domain